MTTRQDVVRDSIRAEMARRRVSQATLAAALGITQQAVSQKLSGRRPLVLDEVLVIADQLGVPASSLLPEERLAS